nr:hypothetical protein [Nocardia vinacea]
MGAPDRSPRGQTQAGSALAGEFGASGERAGQLLPWRQTSVFDQGSGGGEPGGVAGSGQDRRCTDRRESGDGGDQVGEPKLVEHVDHSGLGVGEASFRITADPAAQLRSA